MLFLCHKTRYDATFVIFFFSLLLLVVQLLEVRLGLLVVGVDLVLHLLLLGFFVLDSPLDKITAV